MKVSVIGGSGYIGLVTGIGLAAHGHKVICADIDEEKINNLNQGILPIHEKGLDSLLTKAVRRNKITFTTSLKSAVRQSDIIFIAVGTPSGINGEADMGQVYKALKSIANFMETSKTIVIKSTVPVGTHRIAYQILRDNLKQHHLDFDVVSNPEFLREGRAVKDFLEPDRIVIGTDSKRAIKRMKHLYKSFNAPQVLTDPTSAEMIKYACNAYLATRLSYINEIAEICEKLNANVLSVMEGMKHDKRIGGHYLNPGPGFGGPCLNKDIQSLIHFASGSGAHTGLLRAVLTRNTIQIENIAGYVKNVLASRANSLVPKVAILGLSFKAGTDDTRNSPALHLLSALAALNVQVSVYDPVVKKFPISAQFPITTQLQIESQLSISTQLPKSPQLPDLTEKPSEDAFNVAFAQNPYVAAENATICIFMTEWEQFKDIDLESLHNLMAYPSLLDTRNIIDAKKALALGFEYKGIGICPPEPELEETTLQSIV